MKYLAEPGLVGIGAKERTCLMYLRTTLKEDLTYIGLTEDKFKTRWYYHRQSFKNSKYRLSTELLKAIWNLKEKNSDIKLRSSF